jgi:transposase
MKPKHPLSTKQKPPAVNSERSRTIYTKEFKLQAVEMLRLGQKNATELAMELGIRRNMLYKWAEALDKNGSERAFSGGGRLTANEESEITRLKRELEQVKEERDILKKAATYFARQLP